MGRDNKVVSVAFLTVDQATLYGGYAAAAKLLKVDIIRPPIFLEEHWVDLQSEVYPEVGHA